VLTVWLDQSASATDPLLRCAWSLRRTAMAPSLPA